MIANLKYKTAREFNAEIRRLETLLALPPGRVISHLVEGNLRVNELTAMAADRLAVLLRRNASAPGAAGPSASSVPAPAGVPANRIPATTNAAPVSPQTTCPRASSPAPALSRKVCIAVMCEVFSETPSLFWGVSDPDLLEDVKARCKVACLSLPGEPAAQHNLFGIARIMRGQKQDRLNRILANAKP